LMRMQHWRRNHRRLALRRGSRLSLSFDGSPWGEVATM
jgi:hypothetical protein